MAGPHPDITENHVRFIKVERRKGSCAALFEARYKPFLPEDLTQKIAGNRIVIYDHYARRFSQHEKPLMVAVLIAAGLQMICFGAMAEYIGRSYLLMSRKPQSAIREVRTHPFFHEVSIASRAGLQERTHL